MDPPVPKGIFGFFVAKTLFLASFLHENGYFFPKKRTFFPKFSENRIRGYRIPIRGSPQKSLAAGHKAQEIMPPSCLPAPSLLTFYDFVLVL